MMRKIGPALVAAAAPLGIALVAVGCGGSANASPYGTSGAAASQSTGTAAPSVRVSTSPLGRILVDGRGRTLYLFEKDARGASTCNGACASIWPPLTVKGAPRGGAGVLPGKLGTTRRKDGALEVTYNRHPLYYYVGDTKPGDRKGQGLDQFGAEWYVVSPGGTTVG